MSYLQSFPKELIDALTWLGKRQWLRLAQSPAISESKGLSLVNEAKKYGSRFADEVLKVFFVCTPSFRPNDPQPDGSALSRMIHLFVASQVLATGQKTFLLSQELCEAFENTGVTVPFREYRQPYDTMVIELPARYAESKVVDGLAEYPTSIVIHHNNEDRFLVFDLTFQSMCSTHYLSYKPDEVVEDWLTTMRVLHTPSGVGKGVSHESLLPYLRIALNAMIAMTYGVDGRKVTLTRKQQQTKKSLQKRAEGKNKFVAHRARLHLAALPTYFQFDQKIKAFDEQQAQPSLPSNTTGSPKKPHWRKGHWRWQAVGKGRREREMIWIRPKLIRADRFGGDLKDTTTTYTT